MARPRPVGWSATFAAGLLVGCAAPASWVYRDAEYGVIRVPLGSEKNEAEAIRMARQAYPGGVALVRIEQVPVGDHKVENIVKADAEIDGGASAPINLVRLNNVKAERQRTTDETSTSTNFEIRYVFRNLARQAPSAQGLAYDPDPKAILDMYIDPLLGKRSHDVQVQLAAQQKAAAAGVSKDGEVLKASQTVAAPAKPSPDKPAPATNPVIVPPAFVAPLTPANPVSASDKAPPAPTP